MVPIENVSESGLPQGLSRWIYRSRSKPRRRRKRGKRQQGGDRQIEQSGSRTGRWARCTAPLFTARFWIPAAFFLLFYLYTWLGIDPRLSSHGEGSAFYLGHAFFKEHAARAGGLVAYLAAFLLQSYTWSWLGALVITIVAWSICRATRALVTRISGAPPSAAHLLPGVFVLIALSRYDDPVMEASLGLLAVLLVLVGYVRMPVRRTSLRLAVFLLVSVPLYYLAGAPYLLFALLSGLFEALTGRRALLAACVILAGAGIPYVAGAYLFEVTTAEAYTRSLTLDPMVLSAAFYLSIPLAAIALWLRSTLFGPTESEAVQRGKLVSPSPFPGMSLSSALALFVVSVAGVALSFDGNRKALLQVNYYAQQRTWPRVLQAARPLSEGTMSTVINTRRALFHTGRLLDEMFRWPQLTHFDMIPSPVRGHQWYMTLSDLFFELGYVSYAEKWAHEALEMQGNRAEIIARLAQINMLKGRIQAARTFLGLLRKNPLYRTWAGHRLRELGADAPRGGDAELIRIRSAMLTTDFPNRYLPCEPILLQLLHTNRNNHMALEYLIAHYLLSRDIEKAVEQITRLHEFGSTRIPRHCEEALLLYAMKNAERTINLHGLQVSVETRKRHQRFCEIIRQHSPDRRAARLALADDYGDTYWFYGLFGGTGTAPSSTSRESKE